MTDLDFRYFYEVARTLNFSQAAERLYISQPALSRCISKLEQEFDTLLFTRTKHDVHLTNAGMALLNNYPLVQQANAALMQAVQNVAKGVDATLTVGIQAGHLITQDIKRALACYQTSFPNTQINIVSLVYNELFNQLDSGQIDVAFALDFPNNIHPNIRQRTLVTKQCYALVSRDHPAACADAEQALKLLNGMDLMMVEWTIVPNVTSFIVNQCMANGFQPANIHYAPSYLTLYNWLLAEKGFVIMNKDVLFSEEYICYIPLLRENHTNFCVYWHQNTASSAASQFLECLYVPESGGCGKNGEVAHMTFSCAQADASALLPGNVSQDTSCELDADFFLRLLDQPSCKTAGVCDGCGKCR